MTMFCVLVLSFVITSVLKFAVPSGH